MPENQQLLIHNVFFTLREPSAQAKQNLVADCEKYLKDHPGVVYFAAGERVEDLTRDVNDQEFHVGLHIIFDSRAAHDTYQTAEEHLRFIAENQASWAGVRVFDSETT